MVGAARGAGVFEPSGLLQTAVAEAVQTTRGRETFFEDAVTNFADEVLWNGQCEDVIPISMGIAKDVLECVRGRHLCLRGGPHPNDVIVLFPGE